MVKQQQNKEFEPVGGNGFGAVIVLDENDDGEESKTQMNPFDGLEMSSESDDDGVLQPSGLGVRNGPPGKRQSQESDDDINRGEEEKQENVIDTVEEEEDEVMSSSAIQGTTPQQQQRRNSSSAKRTGKGGRKEVPGEPTLRRLMEEATYQIEQDAYMGLARYTTPQILTSKVDHEESGNDESIQDAQMQEATATPPYQHEQMRDAYSSPMETDEENFHARTSLYISPSTWELACCPFVTAEKEAGVLDPTGNEQTYQNMVRRACNNQCPTLIDWTERAIEANRNKKARKRKKSSRHQEPCLGQRPKERNIRCRCDVNPFCLNTLGGAMNDVIMRDLKHHIEANGSQSSINGEARGETKGSNGSCDDDVEVVEVDPSVSYRPSTREKMKKIRRSTWVETDRIRNYLRKTLRELSNGISMTELIRRIRSHHRKLIFDNPVEETQDKPNHIQISIPPGISNLGATCYLNTQLQCLAQNLVFLKGIFSWEPPKQKEKHDRMTSVLQLFQSLLASMNGGPNAKTDTLDFSNALQLDHFEQQDPNEFSRLFFERMHESFKNSAGENSAATENDTGDKEDKENDLAALLPHLFQGVIRYETTCLHDECKSVSTRNEEFMDINLTITKPDEEEKRQKTGQRSILEFLVGSSSSAVIDVQFCLERYCQDETLSGDNQYFCSACETKRDATRHLCFQKLPPILNVQLSRYIFDLKALTKKKLLDKVLLPRTLVVEEQDKPNSNPLKKEYVLCAVMKHQGKSAYSGHYIAEAMDWVTGEWFEFNDEKVSLLKAGPSNSFEPSPSNGSTTADGKEKGKKPHEGSQDAYNLYYVEKDFLSASVFEYLQEMQQPSVLVDIAKTRSAEYQELTQYCLDDQMVNSKMMRRKELILEKMFPPNYTTAKITPTTQFMFVDSELLRRFLACDKPLAEELGDSDFAKIQAQYKNCPHNSIGCCLQPRDTRRGKLIPLGIFESMVEILKETEDSSHHLDKRLARASEGLRCLRCEESFRQELRETMEIVRSAVLLYDKLAPKEDEAGLFESDGDGSLYLVSRAKFVTPFRAWMVKLMKLASAADQTAAPDASMDVGFAEGGVGVDLLSLCGAFQDILEHADIEMPVNKSITCEHDDLSHTVSKRTVRPIPRSLWVAIELLFPEVITHAQPLSILESGDYVKCGVCAQGDLITDAANDILKAFAEKFRKQAVREATRDDIVQGGSGLYRLVDSDGLRALQHFCRVLKKPSAKNSLDCIRAKLNEIFRPTVQFSESQGPDVDCANSEAAQKLWELFHPLVCVHSKAIKCALERSGEFPQSTVLDDGLALLCEHEYRKYTDYFSVIALLFVKFEKEDLKVDELELNTITELAETLRQSSKVEKCHPTVEWVTRAADNKDGLVCMEVGNCAVFLKVHDGFCSEEACNQGARDWFLKFGDNNANRWTHSPSTNTPIPIDDDDDGENGKKKASQDKTMLSLPLVEVDEGAGDEKILECLSQRSGMPLSAESLGVRRSTRRKKPVISSGVINAEETVNFDFKNNLAALRLLLMERCQKGQPFALSHQIKLVVWPKSKASEIPITLDVDETMLPECSAVDPPIIIYLSFFMNEKRLIDICDEKMSTECNVSDLKDRVYLVRSALPDPSAKDVPDENLMDHLINLSSAAMEKYQENGKRKKPAPEKGFTGTFLTSSAPAPKSRAEDAPRASNDSASARETSALKEKASSNDGGSTPKRARFCETREVIGSEISGLTQNGGIKTGQLGLLNTLAEVAVSNGGNHVEDKDENISPLAFELAQLLIEQGCKGEEECLQAASYATRANPDTTDARSLYDQAFAKYLGLTE